MKILLTFFIYIFFIAGAIAQNENISRINTDNYDEIYENIQEPDFKYIFGIDPKQTDEYQRYMFSPYPLFRTGVNLIFKSQTITPGYYLLTPREKNGKTYILFKDNGKVKYTIPIYKEELVPPNFYNEKLERKKPNAYEKVRNKTMDFIGTKWGKKNQRTPIPETFIEFQDEGTYWNMILYYGEKKYYILFKKDL